MEWVSLGTFWFWILIVFDIILMFILVSSEKKVAATVSLILSILFFNFISQVPIFRYIMEHPKDIILYIVIYFIIGLIWSIIRYYFKLLELKKEYLAYKARFPEANKPIFENTVSNCAFWMVYWPINLIWFIASDFCIQVCTAIQNSLGNCYRKLFNKVFDNL